MTEEQIKQNAEEYANKSRQYYLEVGCYEWICDAHEAGAHSRDEEVNHWKESYEELAEIADDLQTERQTLMIENAKLRNPWIEDRLPKTKEDSPSGLIFAMCYDLYDLDDTHGSMLCLIPCMFEWKEIAGNVFQWEAAMDYPYNVEDISAWMPIQELKKGK